MKTALQQTGTASLSEIDKNHFKLSGTLNFHTVPQLMKQAEGMLARSTAANVDFSAVEDANSAGLALLLEMLRFMRSRNATVEFKNIPEQIAIMARAYGIDSALDSTEFATQAKA